MSNQCKNLKTGSVSFIFVEEWCTVDEILRQVTSLPVTVFKKKFLDKVYILGYKPKVVCTFMALKYDKNSKTWQYNRWQLWANKLHVLKTLENKNQEKNFWLKKQTILLLFHWLKSLMVYFGFIENL